MDPAGCSPTPDAPCTVCPVVGAPSQESPGPCSAGYALLPQSPSTRLLHQMANTALTMVHSAFLLCCANKPHEVGERPATSWHTAGAQPEQDREAQVGNRRERQPRACLGGANPKMPREHEAPRTEPQQNPPSRRSCTADTPSPADLLLP